MEQKISTEVSQLHELLAKQIAKIHFFNLVKNAVSKQVLKVDASFALINFLFAFQAFGKGKAQYSHVFPKDLRSVSGVLITAAIFSIQF
jgi:hypothetical protein